MFRWLTAVNKAISDILDHGQDLECLGTAAMNKTLRSCTKCLLLSPCCSAESFLETQ